MRQPGRSVPVGVFVLCFSGLRVWARLNPKPQTLLPIIESGLLQQGASGQVRGIEIKWVPVKHLKYSSQNKDPSFL